MYTYTQLIRTLLILCLLAFALSLTACTVTTYEYGYGNGYNYDSPYSPRANQRFINSGTERPYGYYRPRY